MPQRITGETQGQRTRSNAGAVASRGHARRQGDEEDGTAGRLVERPEPPFPATSECPRASQHRHRLLVEQAEGGHVLTMQLVLGRYLTDVRRDGAVPLSTPVDIALRPHVRQGTVAPADRST